MKKFTYFIIILIIIVAIVLLIRGDRTEAPLDDNGTTTETEVTVPEPEVEEGPEPLANEVTIDVSGTNFAFSEETITVQKGDTVTINFTSDEGFHDWVVDEFNAATNQVTSGNSASVTFTADTAGEFEYYCSVGDHRERGMVGTLVVQE